MKRRIIELKKNIVFKNFIALVILQVINFGLPLILIPFIVQKIGLEKYGVYVTVQSLTIVFIVIVEYGFNYSATKEISTNINNPEKFSEIFSRIIWAKLILGVISFCILLITIFTIPAFKEHSTANLLSFSCVIGSIATPIWFFQGIQKMQYITYVSTFGRILYFFVVIFYVKIPSDYIFIQMFYGLSLIISGLIGFWFIYRKYKLHFVRISLKAIYKELQSGWLVFISTFSLASYTQFNAIFLSIFWGDLVVGIYGLAEKIITVARHIVGIFSQAIYPHLCKLSVSEGLEKVVHYLRKTSLLFLLVMLLGCSVAFLISDWLITLAAGTPQPESATILKILCIIPIIIMGYLPLTQILMVYEIKKVYFGVTLVAFILNILLNLTITYLFADIGAAFSFIITELFVFIAMHLIVCLKYPKYYIWNTHTTLIK
jgi:polysaccharide transporter, PST family